MLVNGCIDINHSTTANWRNHQDRSKLEFYLGNRSEADEQQHALHLRSLLSIGVQSYSPPLLALFSCPGV